MTNFEKVGLFMKTFGQEIKNKPELSTKKINALRISLIEEELEELKDAINANPDNIASIIIEPIQGEGGDNHFRCEFMQSLRDIADENDIILIYDEVQTGVGVTGKMCAHQHFSTTCTNSC